MSEFPLHVFRVAESIQKTKTLLTASPFKMVGRVGLISLGNYILSGGGWTSEKKIDDQW